MITTRNAVLGAALLCFGAALSACSEAPPTFHASDSPGRLSDWGLFNLDANSLTPKADTLVFRPANQLFSDYAQKLRTLWIPEGTRASMVNGEINYPVGTVVSKTFYYPTNAAGNPIYEAEVISQSVSLADNRLMETRLLVRRESGWDAFPYVWNDEETEAFLRVAGTSEPLNLTTAAGNEDFLYFVPNENQCAGCHVTEHPDGDMHPLGAIANQLAASFNYPADNNETQLQALVDRGWLDSLPDIETPVAWRDNNASPEQRSLAYLNMNCGHCHNPNGAADTSNLILNGAHEQLVNMGVCKPPVAAGGGAGDRLYSIVPGEPQDSILLYRMQSSEPDEMMPELGRSLIHQEGVDLLSQWIGRLNGSCETQ